LSAFFFLAALNMTAFDEVAKVLWLPPMAGRAGQMPISGDLLNDMKHSGNVRSTLTSRLSGAPVPRRRRPLSRVVSAHK
jgi:hypothetical protein